MDFILAVGMLLSLALLSRCGDNMLLYNNGDSLDTCGMVFGTVSGMSFFIAYI